MKRKMYNSFFLRLMIMVFIAFFQNSMRAEYVFLKDGSIIECSIIKDSSSSIQVRLKNNETEIIKYSSILRIVYTDMTLKKIYVQLRNGKVLKVYKVNEDQDSYTFRKSLYKPEEFKLKRNEILHISERKIETVEKKALNKKQYSLGIAPGIIFPIGDFYEMYSAGLGTKLYFIKRNMFFKDLDLGVNLGYYYLGGKNLLKEKDLIYDTLFLLPLSFSASYDFVTNGKFCIKPIISAGEIYLGAEYKDAADPLDSDKVLSVFEPFVEIGVSAGIYYKDYLMINSGLSTGIILEKSGTLNYLMLNAGIEFLF